MQLPFSSLLWEGISHLLACCWSFQGWDKPVWLGWVFTCSGYLSVPLKFLNISLTLWTVYNQTEARITDYSDCLPSKDVETCVFPEKLIFSIAGSSLVISGLRTRVGAQLLPAGALVALPGEGAASCLCSAAPRCRPCRIADLVGAVEKRKQKLRDAIGYFWAEPTERGPRNIHTLVTKRWFGMVTRWEEEGKSRGNSLNKPLSQSCSQELWV